MKSRQGHAIYTAGGYAPQKSVFIKGIAVGAGLVLAGIAFGLLLVTILGRAW